MRLVGVAVLVVLSSAACAAAPDGAPRSDPSPVMTSATDEPTAAPEPRLTAEEIVSDPDARLGGLEVSASDPDVRMADWYVCLVPSCRKQRHALAVTDDGFATRHVVDLPARRDAYPMLSLTGRIFLLRGMRPVGVLVDAGGTVREVQPSASPSVPLAEGEVAVQRWRGGGAVGIDPLTGRSHPLPTPPDAVMLLTMPGGQLRVLAYAPDDIRYFVSDDGGASWRGRRVPGVRPGRELVGMVANNDPDAHVLVVSGDGATMEFWDRMLRSVDGGRTWTSYSGPDDPRPFMGGKAVLPDGRLAVDVEGWSDDRAGKPSKHPTGLSASADWTVYGAPHPQSRDVRVLDIVVSAKRVTFWVSGWKAGAFSSVRRTEDGGLTWHDERAR